MFDQADAIDTVLRGAAAGVSFLLALALGLRGRTSRTSLLGALFSLSTGVYVLISSNVLAAPAPLAVVAIWGTVFFWWFGSALFDDSFQWRWWRFAPLALLPTSYLVRHFGVVEGGVATSMLVLHLSINAVLFADVLRLAIVNAADDLVDPRRRFRVIMSVVVGVFGIGIAVAEMAEPHLKSTDNLLHLQAAAIFALNLFFGAWLLTPRRDLFAVENPVESPNALATESDRGVSGGDKALLQKLTALMETGAYRAEGLTVAGLAEKVGVPEHQLRKLINGALGFRNFSSFLNSYRIEDAKAALSDPDNARKQVIQIALDLGYGSIAPFNRAFKQATGKTPTDFRKEKLGTG